MSRPKGIKETQPRAPGGGRKPEVEKYIEPDPSNRITPERCVELVDELLQRAGLAKILARRIVPAVIGLDDLQQIYKTAVVEITPQTSLMVNVTDIHRLAIQAAMKAETDERKEQQRRAPVAPENVRQDEDGTYSIPGKGEGRKNE